MTGPIQVRLDTATHSPLADPAWACAPSPPTRVLVCTDPQSAYLRDGSETTMRWGDPLKSLEWMEQSINADSDPRARWIGYISYDLGRMFEPMPVQAADDLRLPLFVFTYHGARLVGDPHPSPLPEGEGVDPHPGRLPGAEGGDLRPRGEGVPPSSTFTRLAYESAVRRAIEYIAAGDIFQVNLSQRFGLPLDDPPAMVYERLQQRFPAIYGAMLDYGDFALLCNSPELFLRVEPSPAGRRILTRPIKGTRPRGTGMIQALRDSIKDQAELNMIIDLERNDLGRVCRIGSVRVSQQRTIEEHPTVYHGVASVEGTLRDEVGLVELLAATFPGGSITGAPKIRAMQIIEELEPVRRGPYCGAIGYLAPGGVIQLNMAIRTMIVAAGRGYIPVGGGIVADSDPASEFEETLVKARAMLWAAR